MKALTALTIRLLLATSGCVFAALARPSPAGAADDAAGAAGQITFDADANGRLVSAADSLGHTAHFDYNDAAHQEKITVGDRVVQLGYNVDGTLATVRESAGSRAYAYDAFGQVSRATFERGGATFQVDYERDPWGSVTQLIVRDTAGRPVYAVRFDYDAAGQIRAVDDGHGRVTYEYRPDKGEVTRASPGGVRTEFTYTPLGILASVAHFDTNGGALIARYDYALDFATRQVSVTETTRDRAVRTTYGTGPDGQLRALGAAAPAAAVGEVEAERALRVTLDTDGRVGRRQMGAGGESTYYFHAPFGAGRNLVGEVDARGQLSRVFVTAERLSVEFAAARGSTYYLERGLTPHDAALSYRVQTGRSAAEAPAGVRAGSAHLDAELERRQYDLDVRDAIGGVEKSYFENIQAFASHSLAHDARASKDVALAHYAKDLGFQAEVAGKVFTGVLLTQAVAQDLTGLQKEQWSQRGVRNNVYLGHSMEFLAALGTNRVGQWAEGKMTEGLAKHFLIAAGPWTGEGIGLVFTLMRGQGIGSPEAWEHIVDAGFAGVMYWEAYTLASPLGPAAAHSIARHVAAFAADVPDLPRTLLRHRFEEMGTWWGQSGSEQAGSRAWQALITARGDSPEALAAQVKKTPESFTLSGAVRVPLPANQSAAAAFDDALKRGDRAALADLATGNATIRDWIHRAGYSDAQLDQLVSELRAGQPLDRVPAPHIARTEQVLGGVSLDRAASFDGKLGGIAGAVWDAASKRLVLLGDGDPKLPSVKPEWLAAALICVFGDEPQDPHFSLDPEDPNHLQDGWQRAVYYLPELDLLRASDFARVMWEADWTLKQHAFGVEVRLGDSVPAGATRLVAFGDGIVTWYSGKSLAFTTVPWASSVPGFADQMTISLAQSTVGERESQARMWIVVDRVNVRRANGAFLFDEVKLGVRAKRQAVVNGKLVDVEAGEPLAERFAKSFTDHFDELAAESAPLAEVRELAKAMALAKWLKAERITIDPETLAWARQLLKDTRVDAAQRTTVVRARRERRTETPTSTLTRRITLYGGVDLTVAPADVADPGGGLARVSAVAREQAGAAEAGTVFPVAAGGRARPYQAVVMPLTPAAARARRPVRRRGVTYTFDKAGTNVIEAADTLGGKASYSYAADGRLARIEWHAGDGGATVITARGTDGRSDSTVVRTTTTAGKPIEYELAAGGEQGAIRIDGKPYATLLHDPTRRESTIRYADGGFVERVEYDAESRPVKVWRGASGSAEGPPAATYRHDAAGAMTVINGIDIGEVTVARGADGVTTVSGPHGAWSFRYDSEGRLTDVDGPEQLSLRAKYSGDALESVASRIGGGADAASSSSWQAPAVERDEQSRPTRLTFGATPDGKAGGELALDYESLTGGGLRMRTSFRPGATPASDAPAASAAGVTQAVRLFDDGGTAKLRSGRRDIEWTDLRRDHGRLLGSHEKAAESLGAFFERQVGNLAEAPVLVEHDAVLAQQAEDLCPVLLSRFGRSVFVATTDARRAAENLAKLRPIRAGAEANITACVLAGTLKPQQLDVFQRGERAVDWVRISTAVTRMADIGTESNVVLIVADTNEALVRELEQAGEHGLQGKAVILWTCGNDNLRAAATDLVEKHGATAVWQAHRPIEAGLVPPLMSALNKVIADAPATTATHLMDKVIARAIEDATARGDAELVRKLESLRDSNLRSRRDGDGSFGPADEPLAAHRDGAGGWPWT